MSIPNRKTFYFESSLPEAFGMCVYFYSRTLVTVLKNFYRDCWTESFPHSKLQINSILFYVMDWSGNCNAWFWIYSHFANFDSIHSIHVTFDSRQKVSTAARAYYDTLHVDYFVTLVAVCDWQQWMEYIRTSLGTIPNTWAFQIDDVNRTSATEQIEDTDEFLPLNHIHEPKSETCLVHIFL